MNVLRSFQSKRFFSHRPWKQNGETCPDGTVGIVSNEGLASPPIGNSENLFEMRQRVPSFLKGRSPVKLSDPELPNKFKDLFGSISNEILLKRYKCFYGGPTDNQLGKLFVSSNFLCFVERKYKSLKVVIRLEDVENVGSFPDRVEISAYGVTYIFHNFHGSKSGITFISNYLRLTSNNNLSTECAPISNSTSLSHLSFDSGNDIALKVSPSDKFENHSSLKNPAKQPEVDCVSSSDHKPLESPIHTKTIVRPQHLPFIERKSSDGEAIATGVSTGSYVAFYASIVPILLFSRFFNRSVHGVASSLQSMSIGYPPKAFTKFIAYAVLLFLSVSMLYLYYRLGKLPLNQVSRFGIVSNTCRSSCDQELLDSLKTLHSLSRTLCQTLERLESGSLSP